MVICTVEINPWEKFLATVPEGLSLEIGSFVIINTEFGEEAGRVIELKEADEETTKDIPNTIERLATADDFKIIQENNEQKDSKLAECRQIVKNYGLDMKIVDCHFSLDGQRLSFAFIADGRVDFRDLVKELGRHFMKVIRLHQLGVRDEAKLVGNIGSCGLVQCCKGHLKKLGSVTSEFAEDQQIVHRGSERLSGTCGRLKCCLAYEEPHYQELIKKLPAIGTRVKTEHGRGEIVGWHVLKCSVDVKLDPASGAKEDERPVIVEVPIKK